VTKVLDIVRHVEKLAGHKLNKDEGVHHGDVNGSVSGVTVSWMATPEAIREAGRKGHQLLLVHESLYYPYDVVIASSPPPNWMSWGVNRQRRELLEEHDLTCLRVHGSADEICIFDAFAELLGLGKPVKAQRLAKIFEIEECPLDEFVQKVKERAGMSAVRVSDAGDSKRLVKRVGLPWGGLGLFVNVDYQQALMELGCDVMVAGETDNYGFRFAAECGIPMIETSHEISETPGLRRFTAMLTEAFPDVTFHFHENECVWKMR
jgi:putative NIF3 family GTP cyclohydrolase 1 type 2